MYTYDMWIIAIKAYVFISVLGFISWQMSTYVWGILCGTWVHIYQFVHLYGYHVNAL